jgi:hypothetical protein
MEIKVGGISFREVILPGLPLYGEMFDLINEAVNNLESSDEATIEESLEILRRVSAECGIAAICIEKAYLAAREWLTQSENGSGCQMG